MNVRKRGSGNRSLLRVGIMVLFASCALGMPAVAGQDVQEPNDAERDIASRFAFVWDSVKVSAQVFNPSYTGQRDAYECGGSVTVVGKVHILDANDLVGMQVVDPDVLQVVDRDGNDVAWAPLPSRPLRQYQELKYEWPVPRDPYGPPRPVLQPYDVAVAFCVDASQELPPSLSLFQWSAQAVYAEDVIEVDVPFGRTDDWLEVAPASRFRSPRRP